METSTKLKFPIGASIKRFDSKNKVIGKALFPGDLHRPDQLFLKTMFSPIPHAIITKIRIEDALKIPGVIAVLTARDVPINEYGLMRNDQPVLCGPDGKKPYTDHVRTISDHIAYIIAEDETIARAAEKEIRVEFQPLDIISDPFQSMQSGAILIHPEQETNILYERDIEFGDINTAFRHASITIEDTYSTPCQEHAFLQPEAGIAYLDENDQIVVVTGGQWAHGDQRQIAHALDLPEEKIRVVYCAIGGAFGGKEDISVQIGLALAVKKLNEMGIRRSVKTVWSRPESIIGHSKRHPFQIHAKWSADAEGKITGAMMDICVDAGAYASSTEAVLHCATDLAIGPYYIPNVRISAKAVYTNNIPNGSFRAFGSPQVTFASEMQINRLASALGIDPVEIRMRNLIKDGELTHLGSALPKGISIREVLSECAIKAGWENTISGWHRKKLGENFDSGATGKTRGIGIAAGYKSFGIPPDECWAKIEIHGEGKIERIVLRNAAADMGQGAHSVFKQIVSSAVGIPIDMIDLISSDTNQTNSSGSSSASRVTFMAGNAIIGASRRAMRKWEQGERPAVSDFTYQSPRIKPEGKNPAIKHLNFGYGYVAQAVEIEIDHDTGHIHVLNVTSATDVGKAMNPLQVRGQIEGAIIQALGYAKMEDFVQEDCFPKSNSFSSYLVPTIMDIPDELVPIIIEVPDPNGPLGARGMGEMPFIPFSPAFTAATFQATGIWFCKLPVTAEDIVFKRKIG